MSATAQGLNLDSLLSKQVKIVSSEEALRDVTPIDWPDEVINKEKKVIADLPVEDHRV